ncbi:MAG: hypothetical protein E6R08_10300 [Nevskiaceae bacterium]|nr:MAG: hypothetical protein E6R08_10300 [Nevskiaceae bacterium]
MSAEVTRGVVLSVADYYHQKLQALHVQLAPRRPLRGGTVLDAIDREARVEAKRICELMASRGRDETPERIQALIEQVPGGEHFVRRQAFALACLELGLIEMPAPPGRVRARAGVRLPAVLRLIAELRHSAEQQLDRLRDHESIFWS